MPRICVSLRGGDTRVLAEKIRAQDAAGADLIEVRLDYAINHIDAKALRASARRPLIATCRVASEGGSWSGSEKERIKILVEAAESGFDYIDLEARTPNLLEASAAIRARGANLIASHHDFEKALIIPELERILESAETASAAVVKIIGYAHRGADNAPYLAFLAAHPGNVAFAMGPHGGVSRVACPLVGGAWTYASPSEGEECAPGQLTLAQMRGIYEVLEAKN